MNKETMEKHSTAFLWGYMESFIKHQNEDELTMVWEILDKRGIWRD